MPRELFNAAERERLDGFPTTVADEALHHYTLSEADRHEVDKHRRDSNRLGFALQLCALRHLGFVPDKPLTPPPEVVQLLSEALSVSPAALKTYRRQATRNAHLHQAMAYLGFRRATPLDETALAAWLADRALEHDKPLLLFDVACDFLKKRSVVRPGITTLGRFIVEARSQAHRHTYEQLQFLLPKQAHTFLEDVLAIPEGHTQSRLAWLQQTPTPTDASATQIEEALNTLSYLLAAGVETWDLAPINPNRLKWLARIGARSRLQSLLRTDAVKRTCILAGFLQQSLYTYTDDVINMFDQRLWKLYKLAGADFERDLRLARRSINDNLTLLQLLGDLFLDETLDGDLTEQTLYRSKGTDSEVLPNLAPCLTGVLQEDIVVRQWDEMLRFVGSLKLGYVTASLVIQKLQAYPRQHPLLRALQAYGRLPKTLHILKWFAQPSFRRRAGRQLNKSESLHDLRAHLAFANQGKLGTRTNEQLAHQVGCLNLLSNIVIYYNTVEMQKVVEQLRGQGREVQDEHLAHVWPTRYQHVNVYGTYEFDLEGIARLEKQRGLSV